MSDYCSEPSIHDFILRLTPKECRMLFKHLSQSAEKETDEKIKYLLSLLLTTLEDFVKEDDKRSKRISNRS